MTVKVFFPYQGLILLVIEKANVWLPPIFDETMRLNVMLSLFKKDYYLNVINICKKKGVKIRGWGIEFLHIFVIPGASVNLWPPPNKVDVFFEFVAIH